MSVFIAKFGAAGLANAWYPPSYTGVDMVREGLLSSFEESLLMSGTLQVPPEKQA